MEKHGAQTSLESQLERVTTAKNPTTGEIETFDRGRGAGEPIPPTAATNSLSHRDQFNAIERALLIFKLNGLAEATKPMDMGGEIIGEGYKKDGLKYGNQTKESYTLIVTESQLQPIQSSKNEKDAKPRDIATSIIHLQHRKHQKLRARRNYSFKKHKQRN
ncbi:hypothetical protein LRS56_12635 [Pseudomonas poae]|nr:hypothetical protein LRS56_12635 [Pseudomonas poae]